MKAHQINSRIHTATKLLLFSTLFVLLFGFSIQTLTGVKLHYFYFVIASLLIILLNLTKPSHSYNKLYLILLTISTIYNFFFKIVDTSFYLSLATYFLIPICINKVSIYFTLIDYLKLFKIFDIVIIIYFLALLLQILGVESDLFVIEMVMNKDTFHQRYTSIAGGSLALGSLGVLCAIFAFYRLYILEKNKLFFIFIILIGLSCVYFSFSRRFYILFFLCAIFIHLLFSKKGMIKKGIVILLVIIIIIGLIFLFRFNIEIFTDRIGSIFDFSNDGANVERVLKWVNTFNAFLNNIWFGIGIGTTTIIGKDIEGLRVSELFVSESYFLKMLAENGLIFGSFYLLFSVYVVISFFKKRFAINIQVPYIIFIYFFFESISSTSLESPFSSILFWISVSTLFKFKQT